MTRRGLFKRLLAAVIGMKLAPQDIVWDPTSSVFQAGENYIYGLRRVGDLSFTVDWMAPPEELPKDPYWYEREYGLPIPKDAEQFP